MSRSIVTLKLFALLLLCRKHEDRTCVSVPEYGVGGGEHDGLPLQQVEVPHPHRHAEGETVQEALEEPLESVETRRDVLIQQVLLQPPQLLVKDLKLEMIRNSNV